MDEAVKKILEISALTIRQAEQLKQSSKVALPSKKMSPGELALLLNVLAQEYKTTLPALLHKLDRVSGNLTALDRIYVNNEDLEWTPEEDALLDKNEQVLRRWKGDNCVELRKAYLKEKAN